jgi:hypothetical protein
MAERLREIIPVERVNDISDISDAFTFGILSRWYNDLAYTSRTERMVKHVATQDGHPLYDVSQTQRRTTMFGGPKITQSLKFMFPNGPVDFAILRSRTLLANEYRNRTKSEDLDYIGVGSLAWRKKSATTYELIAPQTYFGTVTEPAIATVEGREELSIAIAEDQVIRLGHLVLESA